MTCPLPYNSIFLLQFLKTLVEPTMDIERAQPTTLAIKAACLLFAGPVLTYRCFKQGASRPLRGIAEAEFTNAITALRTSNFGRVVSVRVPRTPRLMVALVKHKPDDIQWPSSLCEEQEYRQRYNIPTHRSVTPAIRRALERDGHVSPGIFVGTD